MRCQNCRGTGNEHRPMGKIYGGPAETQAKFLVEIRLAGNILEQTGLNQAGAVHAVREEHHGRTDWFAP